MLLAPRGFRIIGYDDIPSAAWTHYRLTSFDQDAARMAALALDLLDAIEEAPAGPRVVGPRLVRRRSR